MCNVIRFTVVGTAVFLASAYAAAIGSELSRLPLFAIHAQPMSAGIDPARKSDKLSVPRRTDQQQTIATVEVIGLRDAAVVYRARDGRVLFRADPVANTTIVAKDVTLPEITIRDTRHSPVQTIPVKTETAPAPPQVPARAKQEEGKTLEGCDQAFSPLTASSQTNFTGRCLAGYQAPTRLAAVQQ